MRLPQFTAEASLHKSDRIYPRRTGAAGGRATQYANVPAYPNCGTWCYAACLGGPTGCAVNSGCLLLPDPIAVAVCLINVCGALTYSTYYCILGCPACTACDTCTNCHNTWLGQCFCSGQWCGISGITTPCCG